MFVSLVMEYQCFHYTSVVFFTPSRRLPYW